jgi:hypothetical protein
MQLLWRLAPEWSKSDWGARRDIQQAMIWPFRSRRKQALAHVLNLEKMGEEAYDRMYDARRPQDEWRDAREAFSEAIRHARKAGLKAEAERLQKRLDHIRAVYTHQFAPP